MNPTTLAALIASGGKKPKPQPKPQPPLSPDHPPGWVVGPPNPVPPWTVPYPPGTIQNHLTLLLGRRRSR